MKRETALKHAARIAETLKKVNGIIGTPECGREAYRIRRAWIFGSTAKGSQYPNDLDVIIDGFPCGRGQSCGKSARHGRRGGAKTDKEYRRSYGMHIAVDSLKVVRKRLRENMQMVRIHEWEIDGKFADVKIMIYPRNELPEK